MKLKQLLELEASPDAEIIATLCYGNGHSVTFSLEHCKQLYLTSCSSNSKKNQVELRFMEDRPKSPSPRKRQGAGTQN